MDEKKAVERAIMTISQGLVNKEYSLRTPSRIILFTLFRRTAFPTFLLTVIPTRDCSRLVLMYKTIKSLERQRFPLDWTF